MKLPFKLDLTTGLLLAGGVIIAGYILLEATEPGKPFRATIESLIGSGKTFPPQEEMMMEEEEEEEVLP